MTIAEGSPLTTRHFTVEWRAAGGLLSTLLDRSASLGTSIRTGGEVTEELLRRLPTSLELAFYAVLLGCPGRCSHRDRHGRPP